MSYDNCSRCGQPDNPATRLASAPHNCFEALQDALDAALARAEAGRAPRYCARCGLVWSPVRRGGMGGELQADCPGCELRAALAPAGEKEADRG